MGLTYRGQSLQESEDARTSSYYFDLIEGLPGEPPEVRGTDVTAPGRRGKYRGNRVDDTLELLVEGFISGRGSTAAERREDWRANSELILAVFALDTVPGDLVLTPGSNSYLGAVTTWTISARTLDALRGDIRNLVSFQRWSFRLECVDNDFWVESS